MTEQLVPPDALVPVRRYVNSHLSVSRLKRFEQCPRSFEQHYVLKVKPPEGLETIALDFGTMLHEALESLFKWVVAEEYSGRLPEDMLLEFYRTAWTKSGLSGAPLYQEGLSILRAYIRNHPDVDAYRILGLETEFNLSIGEFTVNGYIDRVDKVDDETVAIIDYKSNRVLFTKEEIDVDLQMSIYALAARELWPWAKKVQFVFHMLRHGIPLVTERTVEQLEDAASYVLATGRQSETGLDITAHDAPEDAPRVYAYPPKLNSNCAYCDHRYTCDAYKDALARLDPIVVATPEALEDVARLREKIFIAIKILEGKKRELEAPIRAALENADEITLGEVSYKLVPWTSSTTYPYAETMALLDKMVDEEGLPAFDPEFIRQRVTYIDPKALEKFLDDAVARVPRAKLTLLRLEIDALKVTTPGAPRLNAHAIKGPSKAAATREKEVRAELGMPAESLVVVPPVVAHEPPPAPKQAKAESEPKREGKGEPDGKWKGREKKPKAPWNCPCGFKGYGVEITKHREACSQAPAKGERTVPQTRAKKGSAEQPQEAAS